MYMMDILYIVLIQHYYHHRTIQSLTRLTNVREGMYTTPIVKEVGKKLIRLFLDTSCHMRLKRRNSWIRSWVIILLLLLYPIQIQLLVINTVMVELVCTWMALHGRYETTYMCTFVFVNLWAMMFYQLHRLRD